MASIDGFYLSAEDAARLRELLARMPEAGHDTGFRLPRWALWAVAALLLVAAIVVLLLYGDGLAQMLGLHPLTQSMMGPVIAHEHGRGTPSWGERMKPMQGD